ncbi:hypothetical protein GALMADRAFT_151999 [Galerina marginata CBS 339.88]|uniref:Anaphase-promoting complex subunit 4-like WD40 domain-containing protein n=1 Tax=Galerina marginata (strain CBS 339.88) TaxID=685588 RepID=A0A067TIQ7_GALM3|nr:hypothetical protein GALMADRAFT_151999 [Galerina marginata CBS 339.88]
MSQEVKVWFTLNQKLQPRLQEVIHAVSLSPDGRRLVTGGSSGVLKIWDISSGRLNQSIRIGSDITVVSWVEMSRRCQTFWVGASDGSGSLYFSASPSYFKLMLHRICASVFSFDIGFPHSPFSLGGCSSICGPVESLATSENVVAVVGNKDIQIWEVGIIFTGRKATSITFSLSDIKGDPKSEMLGSIHCSIASTLQLSNSVLVGKRIHTAHFFSNGEMVIISLVDSNPAGLNSIIAIYYLKPWKLVKSVEFNRRIGSAAVSEDGRVFAFTNLLDGIDVFLLPQLNHCGKIPYAIQAQANVTLGLAFIGPDSLVAGGFGEVCIYKISDMTLAYHLRNSTVDGKNSMFLPVLFLLSKIYVLGPYRCASAIPSRRILAAGSSNGALVVWTWRDFSHSKRKCCPWPSLPAQGVLCAGLIGILLMYIPLIYILLTSLHQVG